jgi:hypothetical protein
LGRVALGLKVLAAFHRQPDGHASKNNETGNNNANSNNSKGL